VARQTLAVALSLNSQVYVKINSDAAVDESVYEAGKVYFNRMEKGLCRSDILIARLNAFVSALVIGLGGSQSVMIQPGQGRLCVGICIVPFGLQFCMLTSSVLLHSHNDRDDDDDDDNNKMVVAIFVRSCRISPQAGHHSRICR